MLKELIYNLLEFISPLLVLITLGLAFKSWRTKRHLQILFLYFLLATFNLGWATYLAHFTIKNLVWYNINGFCSLLFLSFFFHELLQQRKYRLAIKVMSITGLAAYILLLFWDDTENFFSTGYSISSLLIITYSLLFLKEVFIDAPHLAKYTDHTVWIVSSLLTYHLCSYVILITYKIFTKYFADGQLLLYVDKGTLWGVHNVIYFFSCLSIIIQLFRMVANSKRNVENNMGHKN